MSAPSVTVIVPCYNHEKYVVQCLESIDQQTHGELEVVILDDGSTDRTWKLIQGFRFGRGRDVKRIRSTNLGAHAQLNRGLALARGQWIALCNSDDFFAPTRIATMLEWCTRGKARFAFSGVRYVDPRGRDVSQTLAYALQLGQRQTEVSQFPSVGWSLIPTNVAISTGNFFFHRSLIEDVGYFRPYRLCHDWDFLLRTLLVTEPVMVPAPLYAYRVHPQNSFSSLLGQTAALECPELMRRYWKAAMGSAPQNRLAPSPHHWPGYCEVFIEEFRYQPYLSGWENIDAPFYLPEAVDRPDQVKVIAHTDVG